MTEENHFTESAPTNNEDTQPRGHKFHLGIAEQGKLYALEGKHALALTCYREAIRIAVSAGAPEVFFRHYMECTLESLEHMGAFADVVEYCDRAIAHHASLSLSDDKQRDMARVDLVYIHQRRGVVLLKMGRVDEGRAALEQAAALARAGKLDVPLVKTVLDWLVRGFQVDARRIQMEQDTKRYFSVRKDTVDPKLAIQIPEAHLRAMAAPR